MVNHINFVVNENKLKEMAYGDTVYAWLLLHSHYNPDENHNYIYKKEKNALHFRLSSAKIA